MLYVNRVIKRSVRAYRGELPVYNDDNLEQNENIIKLRTQCRPNATLTMYCYCINIIKAET